MPRLADGTVKCDKCGRDCTPVHYMCDELVNDVEGREVWCPECFQETPCGREEHGEGCPTGVFRDHKVSGSERS